MNTCASSQSTTLRVCRRPCTTSTRRVGLHRLRRSETSRKARKEQKSIPLNYEERTGHLPYLLHDVIARLRLDTGSKAPISKAAAVHGDLRRKQGYTVAMVVEESRLLQATIFSTLHNNVKHLEFSLLLRDVVTIADEVDAQLKEQMLRFMAEDAAEKAKGN
jgi:hypothetical protein